MHSVARLGVVKRARNTTMRMFPIHVLLGPYMIRLCSDEHQTDVYTLFVRGVYLDVTRNTTHPVLPTVAHTIEVMARSRVARS